MGSKRKYDGYKKLREKRRQEIRDEMSELRRSIPYSPEAATKIQTLRIANMYIRHLENTLSGLGAFTLEDAEWERKVSDVVKGERNLKG